MNQTGNDKTEECYFLYVINCLIGNVSYNKVMDIAQYSPWVL